MFPLKICIFTERWVYKKKQIGTKRLLEFTEIMNQLIESGLSIRDALEVTAEIENTDKTEIKIAQKLLSMINSGKTFSDSVNELTYIFPEFYRGFILIGDKIGSVEEIFPRLMLYLSESRKMQEKITGALLYPAFILTAASFGIAGLGIFVLPKLTLMFHELGEGTESIERGLFKIKAGIIFVLVIITVGILICKSLSFIAKYEPKVKEFIDRAKISLPVIGKIITDFESLNFSFAMETLTSANISIEHAIEQSMKVIKNSAYSGELKKANEKIKKGQSMAQSFSCQKYFPGYMQKWIEVGEKSANTEQVFSQIRKHFQNKINSLTQRFSSLVEPAVILLLGSIILAVVVTVILPVFNMYGNLL